MPGSEDPFRLPLPFWFCEDGYQHPPHCDEITGNSAERENEIPRRKVNFPLDVTHLTFERMVLLPVSSRLPCTLPRGHEEQKCFCPPSSFLCPKSPQELVPVQDPLQPIFTEAQPASPWTGHIAWHSPTFNDSSLSGNKAHAGPHVRLQPVLPPLPAMASPGPHSPLKATRFAQ